MDDNLSTILDLTLRSDGTCFYTYNVLFTSQSAAQLNQFNHSTYWGSLDSKLYCRVFAASPSLPCNLCGAPVHPATLTPNPSLTPPTSSLPSTHGTLPCGIDKREKYSFRAAGWSAIILMTLVATSQAAGSSTPVHSAAAPTPDQPAPITPPNMNLD